MNSFDDLKIAIGDRMHPPNGGAICFWIIEDNQFYRELVQFHVAVEAGLVCSGAFERCDTALDVYDKCDSKPEVILMDLGLPGMSGLAGIREFCSRITPPKIVVLTVDEAKVRMALERGAKGYLLKTTPPQELARYIRAVVHGGMPLDPMVAPQVVDPIPREIRSLLSYNVSDREREVLQHVMEGLDYYQIAGKLAISYDTARTHGAHLLRKFGVRSKAELRVKAIREKLF